MVIYQLMVIYQQRIKDPQLIKNFEDNVENPFIIFEIHFGLYNYLDNISETKNITQNIRIRW